MKNLVFVLIILANFFVQNSVFPSFQIMGAVPDTSILITVLAGLFLGSYKGGFTGLVIGILQDIVFSRVVGITTLALFVVGIVSGLLKDNLYSKKPWTISMIGIAFTVGYNFLYYLIAYFYTYNIELNDTERRALIVSVILNAILILPLYMLFRRLFAEKTLSFSDRSGI